MPAPIDISIWHSVWSVSKNKEQGYIIPLSQALLDFKVGYWGTAVLAVCFLTLGALVMYGIPESPASNSSEFAKQFIGFYMTSLGQWAFPIIALAAFATMRSTLLTCLDAYPRTLRRSTELLFPQLEAGIYHNKVYVLVDLATTVSFVLAPILAILNYIALNRPEVPAYAKPMGSSKYIYLASTGLLMAFGLLFLAYKP